MESPKTKWKKDFGATCGHFLVKMTPAHPRMVAPNWRRQRPRYPKSAKPSRHFWVSVRKKLGTPGCAVIKLWLRYHFFFSSLSDKNRFPFSPWRLFLGDPRRRPSHEGKPRSLILISHLIYFCSRLIKIGPRTLSAGWWGYTVVSRSLSRSADGLSHIPIAGKLLLLSFFFLFQLARSI